MRRMRAVVLGVAMAAALVGAGIVAACASATGDVQGGDVVVDATPFDPHCAMSADAGTGHTFHELYKDYFGNPATGCGHLPACHADGQGKENAATITHFVCPLDVAAVVADAASELDAPIDAPSDATGDAAADGSADATTTTVGSSEETCYATMTGASGFVTTNDVADPAGSLLYKNLRKSDGTGIMPKDPPCTFSDRDLQRIAAWIAAGANND